LAAVVDNYQTVAKVGEVVEGQGYPVEVDGRPIAIFLTAGTYYATDDICPHQGAPLCDGQVANRSVTCAWHGWRFSLEDGRRLDAPRGKIAVHPVRVVGDEIQISYPNV